MTKLLVSLCALMLVTTALTQTDNPVAVRVDIFVVSVVGGEEQFTEATTARPGQVVEYRLFAVNTGDTTLPAGTVVITGPVPDGTQFVPNSATPSSDSILTEYSVDGTNFSEPPVLIGGTPNRAAEPGEYRAVRWTLLTEMEPGEEVTFIYRVTISN